jgi:hypothetical protein
LQERSASQMNQGLSALNSAEIDSRLLTRMSASSSVAAENVGVEKSTLSIPSADTSSYFNGFEEADIEQLANQDILQAEHLISVISASPLNGDISVQVGEVELQTDLDNMLLEAVEDAPTQVMNDRIHVSAEHFIRFFAQVNVIRNRNAARMTDQVFQLEVMRWVSTGNSRDFPTRFLFCCPRKEWGCNFSARVMEKLDIHVISCKISNEEPFKQKELFLQCRKAGCSKSFSSIATRGTHEREHDWVRRQCTRGCIDGKWFETKTGWDHHQTVAHDDDWNAETTCSYPRCLREAVFTTRQAYRCHLKITHKLRGQELKPYIIAPTHRGTPFGQQSCPHPDCTSSNIQRTRRALEAHLRTRRIGGHSLPVEEATSMVDELMK